MTAWILPRWPAPNGVHGFTTLRVGAGASKPPFDRFNLGNFQATGSDDPHTVQRNRAELVGRLKLPSEPRWLRQVHGNRAVRITTPVKSVSSDLHEADAAVTSETGVVLAVLTADCLPVLFAADDATEIAVAHAGWRGLAAGVLENTLLEMKAKPECLSVWLGPAAGPQAYEVGIEVFNAFTNCNPAAAAAFVSTRPGYWLMDLYALARMRLEQAGIQRISGGNFCTISDSARFYSHRRQKPTGRMATLIHLAD